MIKGRNKIKEPRWLSGKAQAWNLQGRTDSLCSGRDSRVQIPSSAKTLFLAKTYFFGKAVIKKDRNAK